MEEIEVPTEHLHEDLQHEATHGGERWVAGVALSSALFAGLAAVSALLSGHHANEAMLEQLHASDHWAQYQSKGIKSAVLRSRMVLLSALGKPVIAADEEKAKGYEKDQAELSEEAKSEEGASRAHLSVHEVFARAVTFSQIAIALGAIAVLTRRRKFWWVALGAGLLGTGFLIQGFILAARHVA